MSDRKYRQRGYQDDDRRGQAKPRGPKPPPEPRDPRMPRDPRVPNTPGFRQVFRRPRCTPEVSGGAVAHAGRRRSRNTGRLGCVRRSGGLTAVCSRQPRALASGRLSKLLVSGVTRPSANQAPSFMN